MTVIQNSGLLFTTLPKRPRGAFAGQQLTKEAWILLTPSSERERKHEVWLCCREETDVK